MTFRTYALLGTTLTVVLLTCTGCVAQSPPASSADTDKTETAAAPTDPQWQPTVAYSVPANTTDPLLVEKGVTEWLDHHPEYGGVREKAILRRMRVESRFNPCISNGPHHYLLQWRGPRYTGLHKSAGVGPRICPSWVAQMEWMDQEFKDNPRFRSFFHAQTERGAYVDFSTRYLGGRA